MPSIKTYSCTLTKNVPSTPKVGDIILIYYLATSSNESIKLSYLIYKEGEWDNSDYDNPISVNVEDSKCILEYNSLGRGIPYQAIYIPFENVSNIDFTT